VNSLQAKIRTEQLKAVYRQLPTNISAIFAAGLLVFLFRDIAPHELLLTWFGVVVADNGVGAGLLYFYYIRCGQDAFPYSRWNALFTLYVVCTGIVWGVIGVIFLSGPVEYQLFIVALLWALGAGMAALLVAHKPVFYTMVLLLLVPLIIRLAIEADGFYRGLSVVTFLWMISLMYFYHGNHKTMLEAIKLRFLNADLAADLASKKKEAENANFAKSQFLAAASHDLRQPLHAQGLFLAELDNYVDDPTGRRILGGLESSVYAMRKLLNAILDISKLDAGTITPSIEVFSVASVLITLESEFKTLATEKGIDLRVRKCNLSVSTDPVLLERILRNLLANAIRYTSQGRVLVGCRRHAHSVSIQVLDTGIGIANDKQNDIFIPFMQLGNPERDREKGLGLGLSIVERTAVLLGHTLNLKSTQGKGTAVSIDVPRSYQTLVETRNRPSTADMENINGKRVLIIDDDTDVRTAMLGLLKSWGCLPLAFQSIHGALKYTDQDNGTIDAILSDFNLPGNTNGIRAIADLRTQYGSTIPAALITGDTSVDRLREAKDSGHLIIHKPVLASELRALISKLVGPS